MSRRPTSVSVSRQSRSDIVGQTHSGIVGPPPFYRGHGPCRVAASWWTKVVLVLIDRAGVGHRCLHERSGRVKATRSSGPTERLSRLVTSSSCDQRSPLLSWARSHGSAQPGSGGVRASSCGMAAGVYGGWRPRTHPARLQTDGGEEPRARRHPALRGHEDGRPQDRERVSPLGDRRRGDTPRRRSEARRASRASPGQSGGVVVIEPTSWKGAKDRTDLIAPECPEMILNALDGTHFGHT
jgi:hypothetical protein